MRFDLFGAPHRNQFQYGPVDVVIDAPADMTDAELRAAMLAALERDSGGMWKSLTWPADEMLKALKPGGTAAAGMAPETVAALAKTAESRANRQRGQYRASLSDLVLSYQDASLMYAHNGIVLEDERRQRLRRVVLRAAQREIREVYRGQWEAGREAAGNQTPMTPKEQKLLTRLYRAQQAFLDNFLRDIDEGACRMPLERRIALYAQCAREAYWAGFVFADLSSGRYLQWQNGVSEHCVDCTKLAQGGRWPKDAPGTFTATELSRMGVYPGCGKLSCCTNCRCVLVPTTRPKAKPIGKPWYTVSLKGPGYSSLEGSHRSDRGNIKRRLARTKWSFKGFAKSLFDPFLP